jgi:hypothetical protein
MLSTNAAKTKDKRTAKSGVELQHRHFSFIAETLAKCRGDLPNVSDFGVLVGHFADECAKTNPKFSRDRFVVAAFNRGE